MSATMNMLDYILQLIKEKMEFCEWHMCLYRGQNKWVGIQCHLFNMRSVHSVTSISYLFNITSVHSVTSISYLFNITIVHSVTSISYLFDTDESFTFLTNIGKQTYGTRTQMISDICRLCYTGRKHPRTLDNIPRLFSISV